MGYSVVRNLEAEDGLWLVGGKREAVYVRADIKGVSERLSAVRRLQEAEQERADRLAGTSEQIAGMSVISVKSVIAPFITPLSPFSSLYSLLRKHE